MRAVIINKYGTPDVLEYRDTNQPTLKRDQMLVRCRASSVNPIDWKIRKGMLKPLTGNKFPKGLGFDVSGVVEAVGERVTKFKAGDEIYARIDQLSGGAYAEYVAVSERVAAMKPSNMSHEEAAAVPLAALTALQALRDQGKIKKEQKVLINGASGGVGTFAVQIAKVYDTQITGVCSGNHLELVRDLGADMVIDYTQQDFTETGFQYDIIFDVVGNRSFAESAKRLASGGVYITTQPTPKALVQNLAAIFRPGKQAKVILMQPSGKDLEFLSELIEAGKIRAVIDRTYALADLAQAHAYSQQGHATGKVVISPIV
jgi:2-desacetyl-2-hydroxyethyl bacteriochlorophyllide A dehydrogenase